MPKFFRNAGEFRAWLHRHAGDSAELVVGFYKRESGIPCMTWPESVDEALCFGWIDGIRARIDDRTYKIRFTPRRPTSTWSRINIAKVRRLRKEGRMTEAGLKAFSNRQEEKSGVYTYEQVKKAVLKPPEAAVFRGDRAAWKFFRAQPPGYRHLVAYYISSAKRPETRRKRLARAIAASRKGIRL